MADRPPLTPERLARLRTWATRLHPDGLHGYAAHFFDGSCPWCAHSEPGTDATFDGNAHDLAVELIDEVVALRARNIELAQAAGMDPKDGRGIKRSLARVPAGWERGTPVQVLGRGALIYRVAPPDQQDRDGRITVTRENKPPLQVVPNNLTYVAQAPLVTGERVHLVDGTEPSDWGTVTSTFHSDELGVVFVRWDGDHEPSGPWKLGALERPPDVALRWGLGREVTHRSGWPGRVVHIAGATVAVARSPYRDTDDLTWHHVSDLAPRTGAHP